MKALIDNFITAANSGQAVELKGERYIIQNAIIAKDETTLRARFILASVETPDTIFDFEVSAKLYKDIKRNNYGR